ncbi:hypothetical protein [Klebsiella pneumoniae]|uniref:hypothetical protein n=1 Tax=Klebsiella pneumoniae TaxID=573 RepID=UPI000CA3EDD5|nr:hypothetical protein [Klebsiella pneumoniae]MBZ4697591.1 hypothetical protein [Klebsiella pneumoniae]HDU1609558.1 hypothetical protein [Klebsiella pneumoniae]
MTTDITELAQRNELLIANGNETVHLLRHLAENEIDSDYFAVVTECESYGMEVDAELEITKFARHAAEHVAALVEALEKAQTKAIEQGRTACELFDEVTALRQRIAELESRTVTVKLPERYACELGYNAPDPSGDMLDRDDVLAMLADAGIKVEAE